MTVREVPRFRAFPVPTEEEAAAIAVALAYLLEEAAAVPPGTPAGPTAGPTAGPAGLSSWVAEGRSLAAWRGVHELRHRLAPGEAWRLSGRARVWGPASVR